MKAIYEPSGKAKEYSELALNLYSGCSHGCTYCYAPGVLRRKTEEFHENPIPRAGILEQLEKDLKKTDIDKSVLMCFTSDPYQPAEEKWMTTRCAISLFNRYKQKHSILTKNKLVLRDMDIFDKDLIQIGMSVVFIDDNMRHRYEPYASSIQERYLVLRELSKKGFKTFLSIEPVIDDEQALNVIETFSFVDVIKVGKINHNNFIESRVDWKRFTQKALVKLERIGKEYYIKESLRSYM